MALDYGGRVTTAPRARLSPTTSFNFNRMNRCWGSFQFVPADGLIYLYHVTSMRAVRDSSFQSSFLTRTGGWLTAKPTADSAGFLQPPGRATSEALLLAREVQKSALSILQVISPKKWYFFPA